MKSLDRRLRRKTFLHKMKNMMICSNRDYIENAGTLLMQAVFECLDSYAIIGWKVTAENEQSEGRHYSKVRCHNLDCCKTIEELG
ncbi:hypothetical protein WN51_10906 [Melipona quadrifasciata]|uniref:Uncharacterized protein n=1 Tax=Melipona quadrifasciata TaxID=166423 RepID=A0A0M9A4W5_9HYME|nr:hypothetical protein WN51_10906 [Melipona quadrifasciata]